MLEFDPADPFPSLLATSHTYADAQDHAAKGDAWLGLETERIEQWLVEQGSGRSAEAEGHQSWIGLPVKALLTPYTELRAILDRLQPAPGETVVDLGAGYGRMGFVLGSRYPASKFVGYELIGARVDEGNRCLLKHGYLNALLVQADMSSAEFSPVVAEAYFIYDFGTLGAIEKTLADLQAIARTRAITVVGRGRSSRDVIERRHPWLSGVVAPEHLGHYSIYRSAWSR